VVKQIKDKQYRFGNGVQYSIIFQECHNPIWIDREDLKYYRPRGYLRHLKEYDKKDTYRVEKVLQRETRNQEAFYRIKFFKHPDSDNTWVPAKLVDNYEYLERLHAQQKLIGVKLINRPVVARTPTQKPIDRLDINKTIEF